MGYDHPSSTNNSSIAFQKPFRTFAYQRQPVIKLFTVTQTRIYSSKQKNGSIAKLELKSENNNLLIITTSAFISLGVYQYYTSSIYKYPEEIRKNLQKGLFYQNYRNDPNRAVNFYQTALTQAFNHKELDNTSPEVTGIMIQLGGLYEELDRTRDAIDVFTMAYDVIVTPNNTSNNTNNIPVKLVKLEGENKIRSIALAQKLGDLHKSLKQYDQAEKYYVWSVEQLLQSQAEIIQSNFHKSDIPWEIFSRRNDVVTLPSWMTLTDLGASLEALASFYSSQHKYSYALPLYLRALSLINPPESSCHSAVLMNNISEVFSGMGNLEEAQGWAERGLKLAENFRPKKKTTKECEESQGVLLFNLGMISEAQLFAKRIHFEDCINEAEHALQRVKNLTKEKET
ncbi:7298_t:CDS:2 [Diversispora eburnea]|uniref:7298_t:CDS:1 n=1 Tax=Diversispora eburnea TaxID=1213867 RepID=A0A9N8ZJB6_9GLOM|nr:7298_t:CDS:2 [Diversispora eburnea]